MTNVTFGGSVFSWEHHPDCEEWGQHLVVWDCSAARGTVALHKMDDMRNDDYEVILKQHLKTSAMDVKAQVQMDLPYEQ